MKNLTNLKMMILCLMLFGMSSCMKDEFLESRSEVLIEVDKSSLQGEYKLNNVRITLQETNTEVTTAATLVEGSDTAKTSLAYGTYVATLDGDIVIKVGDKDKAMKIKARKEGIVVNAANTSISLETFLSDPTANFVFKEIFFTGTSTEAGKLYNGDKYFILHNNSSDTLYADGLFIAQSDFLTVTKRNYTPDVMKDAFTSKQIIMIPGTGKQYAVAPGADLIIANNAIDHTKVNPKSFDLSKADFEIELIGSINIDNPSVPNAINVSGNLLMHSNGHQSYVMGRFPEGVTVEKFKTDNAYSYSYISETGRKMNFDSFKIPNSYITDAVNVSAKTTFAWLVTDSSLDMGWTYASQALGDDTRYGKSVIRKTIGNLENGKPYLKDTNNSSEDFMPSSKALLLP
ncbi:MULTISPECIES: DUF4876 domain-containing protein [unclassified Sphingobacterium]|uniref:DUF4876 domain-containing protein n=1 Tax=unclassified Sphingobacterium TaxID=2609468 RepID=UPI0020C22838|nr:MULTISPECIES: DUF4876 domain-containing protein [unclassified Sphingobacterium]